MTASERAAEIDAAVRKKIDSGVSETFAGRVARSTPVPAESPADKLYGDQQKWKLHDGSQHKKHGLPIFVTGRGFRTTVVVFRIPEARALTGPRFG